MSQQPAVVVGTPETSGHLRATKKQLAIDSLKYVGKNPKWVLEWMLVIFIMKLIVHDHITMENIMKMLKL